LAYTDDYTITDEILMIEEPIACVGPFPGYLPGKVITTGQYQQRNRAISIKGQVEWQFWQWGEKIR